MRLQAQELVHLVAEAQRQEGTGKFDFHFCYSFMCNISCNLPCYLNIAFCHVFVISVPMP